MQACGTPQPVFIIPITPPSLSTHRSLFAFLFRHVCYHTCLRICVGAFYRQQHKTDALCHYVVRHWSHCRVAICTCSLASLRVRGALCAQWRQSRSCLTCQLDACALATSYPGWLCFCSRLSKFFAPHIGDYCRCYVLRQVPVVCIDSVAYGKWTIVPWNIVQYNVFGGSERGPDLYGTSPWYFYILNLLLNFNILLVLAFASLPSLAITYYVDRKRLGLMKPGPNESSPFTILALRLAPLYLWASILTAQAHKEERFMFPAYPLICFNAAVTIYLLRGWLETAYIRVTKSPYKVGLFHC